MLIQIFDDNGKLCRIIQIDSWHELTSEDIVNRILEDVYDGCEVMEVGE